jgi:hypothetical protein
VRRIFRPFERFFIGMLMGVLAFILERRVRARLRREPSVSDSE